MNYKPTSKTIKKVIFLLWLCVFSLTSWAQREERIKIVTVTPSLDTGQDYSGWLTDDLTDLVPNAWDQKNWQYIDVVLKLEKKVQLTRLSLYDHEGIFTDNPAAIYALQGVQKILIGHFTGEQYQTFVNLPIPNQVTADAILIHKYRNNIPQKIQVYGISGTVLPPVTQVQGIINFGPLRTGVVGDASFALIATSNNSATPIRFTSSNPAVATVTQTDGQWQAIIRGAGTTQITASQAGNSQYLPATPVGQELSVQPKNPAPPSAIPAVITFGPLPEKTAGNGSFVLTASSNNSAASILFTSNNPAVVAITVVNGQYHATPLAAGTAVITASQAASANYQAATISQTQLVKPAGDITNGKIPIYGHRWYQLNNVGNGLEALFDGRTDGKVETGWGKIFNNYDAYYPLLDGEEITIEQIRFFDGEGSNADNPLTLAVINDKWERINIGTFVGTAFNQWVGPEAKNPNHFKLPNPIKNARYLVINATWAYPTEIELYGTYRLANPVTLPSAQVLAQQKQIKLWQTTMVNAFEWDVEHPDRPYEVDESRLQALQAFTGIRHYLDWEKLEMKEGAYTFSPTHSGGWNYDAMYARLQKENMEVLACIKTLPNWLLQTYPASERDLENVPVRYGKDFSDPKSYLEQAKVAFQFAARYGRNQQVNRALVKVNPATRWPGDAANIVRIGLNYVKYMECDNERDKWWKGRKAYQTGREYAANLSAFYDGHQNTMGPGVGVKNADPTMLVVMGGLASPATDYVRGMIDWCKQYRGYKPDGSVDLCWDVINYHLYANDAQTSQGGNSTRGAAPEVSEAGQVAADFVRMAYQYARGMPVWITETGYDTNPGSPLKAIAVGGKSVLETQADWILRTALLYARQGVERVYFYQLYDENPANPTQFSSMGLLNRDGTRKPTTDYLYQLHRLLGNYAYQGTLHADPLVDRYTYNGQEAFMLVIPDEKGRTAEYTLNLGAASTATVYRPRVGQSTMDREIRNTQNGQIKLTVTETPIFVMAGTTAPAPATGTACSATGTILHEFWANVPGTAVAQIPVNRNPTQVSYAPEFESGINLSEQFGVRLRGYICPPQTGSYTFWVAGDDQTELWLSTDENPTHKVRLAYTTTWTNHRSWHEYATQKSARISLIAGKKYYVEALQKENNGGDHLSVAWQLPDWQLEAPIAGAHLSAYPATPGTPLTQARVTNLPSENPTNSLATAWLRTHPNPAKNQTQVQFNVPTAGKTLLELFNAQGKLVQTVYQGHTSGLYSETLPTDLLPNGLYFLQLTTDKNIVKTKLVVLK